MYQRLKKLKFYKGANIGKQLLVLCLGATSS